MTSYCLISIGAQLLIAGREFQEWTNMSQGQNQSGQPSKERHEGLFHLYSILVVSLFSLYALYARLSDF